MNRGWRLAAIVNGLALAIALPAGAADIPLKAHPTPPPPPPSWTGFYVGAQIGAQWSDRRITYAGNDPIGTAVVNGIAIGGDPIAIHGINSSGVTGGVDAGFNWQIDPSWLVGLEADFSIAGIKGSGNGTSVLAAGIANQTVASEQKLDWWGTVRARLGWLARPDLLLYGTGGFAYGKVALSDSYVFNAPAGGLLFGDLAGFSIRCNANATCMSGATSGVKYGWTAGAGGEWRWTPNWTFKAEYLYVNLDNVSVNAFALAVNTPGATPASYRANFGVTDFHVVRLGANYHF